MRHLSGLQTGAGQLLDPLVVEAVGLLPEADCQPPDRFWGDACESRGSLDGATFSKLLGNSDGFAFPDFAIPQRGVLTFTELALATQAAYPANPSFV